MVTYELKTVMTSFICLLSCFTKHNFGQFILNVLPPQRHVHVYIGLYGCYVFTKPGYGRVMGV